VIVVSIFYGLRFTSHIIDRGYLYVMYANWNTN